MSNNNNYNVGVIGKKIKSSINVNVLKHLIKDNMKYSSIIYLSNKPNISSAVSIYLTGSLEKLFQIIFTISANQIETVNDFIMAISTNKKLMKLFYPILDKYIVKTEYFPINFVKNHKTSKYIKSDMFQNILNTYNITNIKLTYELTDLLNAMFYYVCNKIITISYKFMNSSFRKTLQSSDIQFAIRSIIPHSIGAKMISHGTVFIVKFVQ